MLNTKLEDIAGLNRPAAVDRIDYAICERIREIQLPSDVGTEGTCIICNVAVLITEIMRDFTQAPAICVECALKKIKS